VEVEVEKEKGAELADQQINIELNIAATQRHARTEN